MCEDDWDTVGFPVGEGESEEKFCQAKPWSFEVPLYAGWTAIAHVSSMSWIFFLGFCPSKSHLRFSLAHLSLNLYTFWNCCCCV